MDWKYTWSRVVHNFANLRASEHASPSCVLACVAHSSVGLSIEHGLHLLWIFVFQLLHGLPARTAAKLLLRRVACNPKRDCDRHRERQRPQTLANESRNDNPTPQTNRERQRPQTTTTNINIIMIDTYRNTIIHAYNMLIYI